MNNSRIWMLLGAGAAAMIWSAGAGAQAPAGSKAITEAAQQKKSEEGPANVSNNKPKLVDCKSPAEPRDRKGVKPASKTSGDQQLPI